MLTRRLFLLLFPTLAVASAVKPAPPPRRRRCAVDHMNPGFNPDFMNANAYLNGVEVKHCVYADELLGTVTVLDREWRHEKLYGDVEIRWNNRQRIAGLYRKTV